MALTQPCKNANAGGGVCRNEAATLLCSSGHFLPAPTATQEAVKTPPALLASSLMNSLGLPDLPSPAPPPAPSHWYSGGSLPPPCDSTEQVSGSDSDSPLISCLARLIDGQRLRVSPKIAIARCSAVMEGGVTQEARLADFQRRLGSPLDNTNGFFDFELPALRSSPYLSHLNNV